MKTKDEIQSLAYEARQELYNQYIKADESKKRQLKQSVMWLIECNNYHEWVDLIDKGVLVKDIATHFKNLVNDKVLTYKTEYYKEIEEALLNSKEVYGALRDIDCDYIRIKLATEGYFLQFYAKDLSWLVRYEVAKQGECLEELVNDTDPAVSTEAQRNVKYKYHTVVAREFGTYKGKLTIRFNSVDDYVIESGCYSTDSVIKWNIKAETRIGKEEATKYSNLILQELVTLQRIS